MISREEIEKCNKKEIEEIFNNYKKQHITKVSLIKNNKYIFTINKYEVFFRMYIDKNIKVFIRTNTLNSKAESLYNFVTFNELKVNDIEKYKDTIRLFYENIIKAINNLCYCPEQYNEMIPRNATKEEIKKGWYSIYEQRILEKLNYNEKVKFKKWIEKVTL